MSDCNHEKIKCMKCHRYVGISEQVVPTIEAVKRIRELEGLLEVAEQKILDLSTDWKTKNGISTRKGYPSCLIEESSCT